MKRTWAGRLRSLFFGRTHSHVPSAVCAAEDQRHASRFGLFCDAGSFEEGAQVPGQWIFADGYESGDTFAWSDETP